MFSHSLVLRVHDSALFVFARYHCVVVAQDRHHSQIILRALPTEATRQLPRKTHDRQTKTVDREETRIEKVDIGRFPREALDCGDSICGEDFGVLCQVEDLFPAESVAHGIDIAFEGDLHGAGIEIDAQIRNRDAFHEII